MYLNMLFNMLLCAYECVHVHCCLLQILLAQVLWGEVLQRKYVGVVQVYKVGCKVTKGGGILSPALCMYACSVSGSVAAGLSICVPSVCYSVQSVCTYHRARAVKESTFTANRVQPHPLRVHNYVLVA